MRLQFWWCSVKEEEMHWMEKLAGLNAVRFGEVMAQGEEVLNVAAASKAAAEAVQGLGPAIAAVPQGVRGAGGPVVDSGGVLL